MPSSDYYREQARILTSWAAAATDPGIAQRLSCRAHEMLQLADKTRTSDRQDEGVKAKKSLLLGDARR